MAKHSVSKSQRIRDYMSSNPDKGNTEIVAALEQYGVKYADVANVKSLMKKQSSSNGHKKSSGTRSVKAAAAKKKGGPRAARAQAGSVTGSGMPAIQAGVRFVDEAGGVDQAMEILSLIRTVRQD